MAKRAAITPVEQITKDRYLTCEDVQRLLSCSSSHVYMLERTQNIVAFDITCSGAGTNSKGKRYSLVSVQKFIASRKIDQSKKDE